MCIAIVHKYLDCAHVHSHIRWCPARCGFLVDGGKQDYKDYRLCSECMQSPNRPIIHLFRHRYNLLTDAKANWVRAIFDRELIHRRYVQLTNDPAHYIDPTNIYALVAMTPQSMLSIPVPDLKWLGDVVEAMEKLIIEQWARGPSVPARYFRNGQVEHEHIMLYLQLRTVHARYMEESVSLFTDNWHTDQRVEFINYYRGGFMPLRDNEEIRLELFRNILTPVTIDHSPHDQESCGICLESFETTDSNALSFLENDSTDDPRFTEEPVQTPCYPVPHTFGRDCIERWVVSKNNTTCPLCRKDFKPAMAEAAQSALDNEKKKEEVEAIRRIPVGLSASPWWVNVLRGD